MAVTFDQNARFIATAIPCEIMAALKGFNTIMAAFYGCVCPSALMVVHDFFLPIAHGLYRTLDGSVVDLIALRTPTLKSQLGNSIVWRAVHTKS